MEGRKAFGKAWANEKYYPRSASPNMKAHQGTSANIVGQNYQDTVFLLSNTDIKAGNKPSMFEAFRCQYVVTDSLHVSQVSTNIYPQYIFPQESQDVVDSQVHWHPHKSGCQLSQRHWKSENLSGQDLRKIGRIVPERCFSYLNFLWRHPFREDHQLTNLAQTTWSQMLRHGIVSL